MFPKRTWILLALSALILLAGLLAACDVLPQNPNASTEPTLTPTATLDPSGYQAVAPRSCLVGSWQTVQSERKAVGQVHWQQGSLMSWQPGGEEDVGSVGPGEARTTAVGGVSVGPRAETIAATATTETKLPFSSSITASAQVPTRIATKAAALPPGEIPEPNTPASTAEKTETPTLPPVVTKPAKTSAVKPQSSARRLAYLVPTDRTSWFGGELMIATAPGFADRKAIAPGILVAGDLTWSPGGTWLAFLAFRPTESLYTIMAVRADGSGLTDLFPTDLARTDSRTSQKAILGWKDDSTVQVIVSCGVECRNAFDVDLGTASTEPVLTPTPVDNYHTLTDSLAITRHTLPFDPTAYPKNMLDKEAKNDPLTMKTQPNWSPDETMIDYLDKKGILWLLSIPDRVNFPLDIGLRDVIETQWSSDSSYLSVRAEDRIFVFQIYCQKK